MPTPTPERLDEATIDLIFALRDSLTDDGPSRLDFWGGRITSAIDSAAAGADTAAHAVTIACRKLQIETLTLDAAKRAKRAADIIDADYTEWSRHIARNLVYVVALAKIKNSTDKASKKAKKTEEIPF
ncbi:MULTISPECIES: hypothetical protein [Corynebacterium]|uniref:hypothetical protein n=1 Tax=Corynebacterium TaxID=1716 RepID=UPI00124F2926|nr:MULTISPECIES: hypothetical protein [Corynebacterium]